MSEIKILHLSDIHFKKDKDDDNPSFRQDVQQKMIAAVERHLKEQEEPDFVAVTGDIAFSGKESEYDEALKFFDRIKVILPKNIKFLVIPGNHDVDRAEIRRRFSLHRIVDENEIDGFLNCPEDIRDFLNVKFEAYRKFVEALSPGLYKKTDDYFWVKDFQDKEVSFLGLNSSWACEGDKDRFNIAIGFPQINAALGLSKSAVNRIALMHHPQVNWLKDMESGKCRTELFKNCRLLLHGHDHTDRADVFTDPADSIICLGAGPSYTDDKEVCIGFQFIRVDFQEERVDCRVWPYIFDERRRNDFVPDRERYAAQKGKAYFDIGSFEPVRGEKRKTRKHLKIPEEYREWIVEFHSNLSIEELDREGEVLSVPLPRVYIPLETVNPLHKAEMERLIKEGDEKTRLKRAIDGEAEGETQEPPMIDIEKLLGREPCVLLRGGAGMGKTTLVKHLAYSISHGAGESSLKGYLPVMVFLKQLWPLYEKKLSIKNDSVEFESILEDYLSERRCPLSMDVVHDYLAQDRALFLLDGLDEVPEDLRSHLVDTIASFRFAHKQNRFLLTGRPHGISGRVKERFGKYLHNIEPLDQPKIRQFISDWFREISGRATGLAELTAEEMIADIGMNEYVSVFTQNPLLLTAVCILYQDKKRLPEQRADLYGRVVANLLGKRFQAPGDRDKRHRFESYLMRLAFSMMERNLRSIEPYEAKEILRGFFPRKEGEDPAVYRQRIDLLFDEVEPQCGLLKRLSGGEVEFLHLTFQEFMAARYMIDEGLDYKKFLHTKWWEETLLLYIGLVSLERSRESNKLVRDIIDSPVKGKQERARLWLLGARALRDILDIKRDQDVVNAAGEKLTLLIESHPKPEIRFEAGEILGYFGDLRIESKDMVVVESGKFIRGSDKVFPWEKPVRSIYLNSYMIGKYPVTNREFKEFVDEGGYRDEGLWIPDGWQWCEKENVLEPAFWHDRKWNGPNFPVVGVSWFEADAFCKWLSRKTSESYRLPTEAEWEKAARFTDGREYPWGKNPDRNKFNYDETGFNRTSPVGIFPAGKSHYGCFDMAGNVWEWCSDWFDEQYYKTSPEENPKGPSRGTARVLRGGSWFNLADDCRCAFRDWILPDGRGRGLGFRLARSL